MRTVWTWLAIGGAILAVYIAQTFFDLTGSQLAIILLIVGLLALNHQVNSLKEANPKLKKKFVNDLLFSEPIAVKHDRPKSSHPMARRRGRKNTTLSAFNPSGTSQTG